jgi:UDP-2,3-diacylglucosamine pyrophosphatase LpxH
MPKVIFVASDFHYGENQTEVLIPFLKLLSMAKKWDASLFLNGDLFNYWFENRGKIPQACEPFIQGLKKAIDGGLKVTVLRGNRDFLMSDEFVKITGAELIRADKLVIDELKVVITHGDQFDNSIKYQIYRRFVRSSFIRLLTKLVSVSFLMRIINFLRKPNLNRKLYPLPKKVNCPDDYKIVLGHYHQENIRKTEKGWVLFCPAFDNAPKVLKITNHDFEFLKVD